jgi:hypothetical protein
MMRVASQSTENARGINESLAPFRRNSVESTRASVVTRLVARVDFVLLQPDSAIPNCLAT